MMIPGVATMIPLFVLISRLKLLNSVWGFILPQVASSFMVRMLRQNSGNFPPAMLEAAGLDGE